MFLQSSFLYAVVPPLFLPPLPAGSVGPLGILDGLKPRNLFAEMEPNIPTKVSTYFFKKKAHPGEHMYTSSSVSILKQFFKTFRAKFLENSCYKNVFFFGFREVNQFPSLPNMQDSDLQKEARAQKSFFLFSHVCMFQAIPLTPPRTAPPSTSPPPP